MQRQNVEDSKDSDCPTCFKSVANWCKRLQEKPVSPFTLHIRDREMRDKFFDGELLVVKKRWEHVTIAYIVTILVSSIANFGNLKGLAELWYASGDNLVVLILFSLLGMKWPKVHHYSVVAICMTRTVWCLTQFYVLLSDNGWFDIEYDQGMS